MSFPSPDASVQALTAALRARDLETERHSDRVIRLSLALGRRCSLTSEELFLLQCGAALHDIGKVGIPDRILGHIGPLLGEDWTTMQTHPVVGEVILRAAQRPELDPVCRVIRHHHENVDGTGYPDGLRGEDIPAMARMVHLADAYDAMVSDRPYREGMCHRKAIAILQDEAGTRSDAWMAARFTELLEDEPALR
ncbi:HD-GYP domain-containing protein [Xylophilus rhododendri]|uniref:HD-GYP domain-containing protein n=1 Tax=Xylophilus rhododendri TaxID=2697032 RepID=UPI001E4D9698|nr:HD domain-containing phosphohydrolase [Xylophilus rhododendri]